VLATAGARRWCAADGWWCAAVVRGGGARRWCAAAVRGGGARRWCGGSGFAADGFADDGFARRQRSAAAA
jgi:hypothetical protein